jgi:hypothetical protein
VLEENNRDEPRQTDGRAADDGIGRPSNPHGLLGSLRGQSGHCVLLTCAAGPLLAASSGVTAGSRDKRSYSVLAIADRRRPFAGRVTVARATSAAPRAVPRPASPASAARGNRVAPVSRDSRPELVDATVAAVRRSRVIARTTPAMSSPLATGHSERPSERER